MVLSYSYLWSSERDRGETSGRKDRPAAIVVIRTDLGPEKIVYVVPITHAQPAEHDHTKILVPRQIKQRLGLDEERSWVDISEYNAFAWSNAADLRPTRQTLHAKPVEQTCQISPPDVASVDDTERQHQSFRCLFQYVG